jgi:3-oxoacyl-[acyl-carrier-protein] synthase III
MRMAGVASAVPSATLSPLETARLGNVTEEEAVKIADSVGVHSRHVCPPSICTSDLCCAAAEKLLEELGWERSSVEALIFITQTPDYLIPATSSCLHERLQLSKSCAAFDVTLGCSGYVYGLWMAHNFVAAGSAKRVLLLVGETATWPTSPYDRACMFLFGDAGTATALEFDENAPPVTYTLGTDGTGNTFIMMPGGGYRNRPTPETLERKACADGVLRNELDSRMDGAEVFAFTLREVPAMMKQILQASGWTMDTMDAFVPHQANLFMLQHIAKRLKVPREKLVLALDEFGNTSSASVPLSLTHALAERLRAGTMKLVLSGFGVGWSWGAVAIETGPMVVPDLVVIDVTKGAPC